jgi:hypothetical protein
MLFQVERGQEKVRLNCCNCKIAIDVHCGQRAPPPNNNATDSAQQPAAEKNTAASSTGGAGPSPSAGTGSTNMPTGNGFLPNPLSNTAGHVPNPPLQVLTPFVASLPLSDSPMCSYPQFATEPGQSVHDGQPSNVPRAGHPSRAPPPLSAAQRSCCLARHPAAAAAAQSPAPIGQPASPLLLPS